MRLDDLFETYSQDNRYFLNYMRDGDFDPYSLWYEICEWLENNDHLEMVSEILGSEISSADGLQEEEPDIFYKLPKDIQADCAKDVLDEVMQNDPANAPTTSHMSLSNNKPLRRDTWLIHFSDNAYDVSEHGFTHGTDDMGKLGLTTYMKNTTKTGGGYNFAFRADSRDAANAESNAKYGRNAVMFQSSGIHCYHYGDEENQIVFWGKDVNPRDIILLTRDEEYGWIVRTKSRSNRGYVYRGDYQKCVLWVMKHFAQYRRKIGGR